MIRARDADELLTRDIAYANVVLTYSPTWFRESVHLEGCLAVRRRARVERPRVGQLDLCRRKWSADGRFNSSELTHGGQTFGHKETPVVFGEDPDILVQATPMGSVGLQIFIRPLGPTLIVREGVVR